VSVLLSRVRTGGPVHHRAGWPAEGLALCSALGDQVAPKVIPDGVGGAIVAWTDARFGYGGIYAQRVNAGGSQLWGTDGLPVCTDRGPMGEATLAADGNGGAWIGWIARGVHAQHITPAGEFDLTPCPGFAASSDDAFGLAMAADGS